MIDRDKEDGFNEDYPNYGANISLEIESYIIISHIHVKVEKSKGNEAKLDKN